MKLLLITIVSVFAVSAFAKGKNCKDAKSFPEVTKAELQQMIKEKKAFVVDVNSKKSFSRNHIPTAVNYAASRDKFAKLLKVNKDKTMVAYCGGPSCGAWKQAAEEACEKGFARIKHFKGGIKGWISSGQSPKDKKI